MDHFSSYCIHTFRHSVELRREATAGGLHVLAERKRWVTGQRLWTEASRIGERMPIIFRARIFTLGSLLGHHRRHNARWREGNRLLLL